MSQTESAVTTTSIDSTFDALASDRRRRILTLLTADESQVAVNGDSASLETVARHLVALEQGTEPEAVTDARCAECVTSLTHVELPSLCAAGFLEWDRSAETIDVADDLTLDGSLLQATLESTERDWSQLFSALANHQRRLALSVLEEAITLDIEALAAEIASCEETADATNIEVQLHHQHLPVLEAAGLVTVDGRTVSLRGESLESSVFEMDLTQASGSIVVSAPN